MVKDDILSFFRDPSAFANGIDPTDASVWLSGLRDVAEPAIAAAEARLLRPAQSAAWEGIACHRAALLLGPPGSGKTFALSWMALGYLEACRRAGRPCRVLVTGFTRNAIGNLLEAIAEKAHAFGWDDVALGFVGDRPLEGLSPGIDTIPTKDAAGWLETPHVVAGMTSWALYKVLSALKSPIAHGPTAPLFDLVCIDEASQMVVSQGLLSLAGLASRGRVLVAGDNKQLPPVRQVNDREIEGRKLGASLYDFMQAAGVAEFRLNETFRLNAPLTQFPSERFYDGDFYSVVDEEDARLGLVENWREGLEPWEIAALDDAFPVCVIVHDGPAAGTSNPFEVQIATRLAELLRARVKPRGTTPAARQEAFWQDQLAIVSPHRAQNALIRDSLHSKGLGQGCVVETVDRIQGRERDAVIASYTVADSDFALAEGAFIFSAQRFNVTVTRARHKLIMLVSRRLFDAIPSDEGTFDAAQALRDFVFTSVEAGNVSLPGPDGVSYPATIRLRGFGPSFTVPNLSAQESVEQPEPEALSLASMKLLDVIRTLALQSDHGTVTDSVLSKHLPYQVSLAHLLPLFRHGLISRESRHNPKTQSAFWVSRPLDPPLSRWPVDAVSVRTNLEDAVEGARRGRGAPLYERVRDRFDWLADDGDDRLKPVFDVLASEGIIEWGQTAKNQLTIELSEPAVKEAFAEPAEALLSGDFTVLNRLEDIEAKRINFGLYEHWTTQGELAHSLGMGLEALGGAIRRLEAHGHLMMAENIGVRSRMAELAREVRQVKQRFQQGDAQRRPYVVRSLKVVLKERDKPVRDQVLADVEAQLVESLADSPEAVQAMGGLAAMLRRAWRDEAPLLAGFQRRALAAILTAWVRPESDSGFVITADTGSGKTEAACLPLIAGAVIDRLKGVRGTRAVLIYPRVQLGANQAQRLVGYLAALQEVPGMPVITVGIQNGKVPTRFEANALDSDLWKRTSSGGWTFPFFRCPACDTDLWLAPAGGACGADRLDCVKCGWRFDGWVGSKAGLVAEPPALFLPVTESLHQWLSNPVYAALFGHGPFAPPRAVLADEIHLYSHIHGAQIGYMLRRVLERIDSTGVRPLAIGMSATLGNPTGMWGSLVGRSCVAIQAYPEERTPNARGREYFYFVQPEVESRGSDIAGASSTIQSLMVLAHGMRRRRGKAGGYRTLVFLDSIDKVKRLHSDYTDAEEGKRLAQFRTRRYDDDSTSGQKRRECCRNPVTCTAFKDGECWYFAATDAHQVTARGAYRPGRPLKVSNRPVFSGTGGRVEEMIKESDVVFATSSLEVGYDDPDISLVYQHYAPVNVASFVQRKGRGGRGADDRPLTGVTLSVYSPRDSWYFRNPNRMLEAANFEVPLNMENHFVRRGQVIAMLLDVWAAEIAKQPKMNPWPVPSAVIQRAQAAAERSFGADIWHELSVPGLAALWKAAASEATEPLEGTPLKEWRVLLPSVPTLLFETINLPALKVAFETDHRVYNEQTEDIVIAFNGCAPGNMTRRYAFGLVHWLPPTLGLAPMMSHAEDYDLAQRFELPGGADELISGLPIEAQRELGSDVASHIVRPVVITLTKGGRKDQAFWTPAWGYDDAGKRVVSSAGQMEGLPEVGEKSRGNLRGFLLLSADPARGIPLPVEALASWAALESFTSQPGEAASTGLNAVRVFWGSDAELVLNDRGKRGEATIRQTFTEPGEKRAVVHGYGMETEGVRMRINSATLDSFIEREVAENGGSANHPLRTNFLRYALESRLSGAGWNIFQARQLAELLTTGLAFEDTRRELQISLKRWDSQRFVAALNEVYRLHLSEHPMLTANRVERLAQALKPTFPDEVNAVLREVGDEAAFRGYLRSCVLHGLAIKLGEAFVRHGRGDERRVLLHAKLPIQFGDTAEDLLSVVENGELGDGTTRTFIRNTADGLAAWAHGELAECPSAEEDALIDRVFSNEDLLAACRSAEPSDLDALAKRLGIDVASGALQGVRRLLFNVDEIGAERFAWSELHLQVRSVRERLERGLGRTVTVWELVSELVTLATTGAAEVADWTRLHEAYGTIEEIPEDGTLGPTARLAEQAYRMSARLCQDGCPACLHVSSTLMSDSLTTASVSRTLLARFAESVNPSLNGPESA